MTAQTYDVAGAAPAPSLSDAERWRILGYVGGLVTLIGFAAPTGGLIGLPIVFFLKNRLHMSAQGVSMFSLLAQIPVYVSIVFGLARDRWSPFGLGDRGYMILFGALSAALYGLFAFTPPGYGVLLAANLVLVTSFLFIASALRGLTSTLGQQRVMSGQLSAVFYIFEMLPRMAALAAGGMFSQWLEGGRADAAARSLFLVGAALAAAIAALGLLKPASVFGALKPEPLVGPHPLADLRRLLAHKPIYPAMLIWLMWGFAPGSVTSLQFYMQNSLHASDAQVGAFDAIASGCFLPPLVLYGALCRRVPLNRLLFWGTIVGIPQFLPLIFIHSIAAAMWVAVFVGLTGGVATAAYFDLIIRSCPRGLQGTLLMASVGLAAIVSRFGDVLGTAIYDHLGGFPVCAISITAVYVLILPVLRFVDPRLTATADGEAPAGD